MTGLAEMSGDWRVEWASGSAADFHGRELPAPVGRAVWVFAVDSPALVLGSAQSDDVVDREAASRMGVEIVRRRSGGGAVLLDVDETVWIDVLLPADDPRWDDDVSRAGLWLGELWVEALGDLGVAGAAVHRGPMVVSPLGSVVCFAGLAPGEVTVGRAKAVGVAQRRTRAGGRFQCFVPRVWRPERYRELLAPGLAALEGPTGSDALSQLAVRSVPVSADAVAMAFLGRLVP